MTIKMFRVLFLLSFFAGFLLVSVPAVAESDEPDSTVSLVFGVYPSDKASVMHLQFRPIIKAISAELEGVDIKMKIFKDYQDGIDALANGDVDFARFGPASYILAKEKNADIKLLAMEEKKGRSRFKGVIITQADSDIKSLADLKGRTFAFGNENSTIGRFLSQSELIKNGIYGRDLEKFDYLDRHDKVAYAVELGDYDAGAVKEGTYKKANKDGKLRVLVAFDNVTKPWVARAGLDKAVFEFLEETLVSFTDEAALKSIGISGFRETSDKEYEVIRDSMKAAESF